MSPPKVDHLDRTKLGLSDDGYLSQAFTSSPLYIETVFKPLSLKYNGIS